MRPSQGYDREKLLHKSEIKQHNPTGPAITKPSTSYASVGPDFATEPYDDFHSLQQNIALSKLHPFSAAPEVNSSQHQKVNVKYGIPSTAMQVPPSVLQTGSDRCLFTLGIDDEGNAKKLEDPTEIETNRKEQSFWCSTDTQETSSDQLQPHNKQASSSQLAVCSVHATSLKFHENIFEADKEMVEAQMPSFDQLEDVELANGDDDLKGLIDEGINWDEVQLDAQSLEETLNGKQDESPFIDQPFQANQTPTQVSDTCNLSVVDIFDDTGELSRSESSLQTRTLPPNYNSYQSGFNTDNNTNNNK